MDKHDKLQQKWHGTDAGDALQKVRRLHAALADQSAQEQEVSRERITELVRALRQGGVYGQYDPHIGFIEEKAGKQPRRNIELHPDLILERYKELGFIGQDVRLGGE